MSLVLVASQTVFVIFAFRLLIHFSEADGLQVSLPLFWLGLQVVVNIHLQQTRSISYFVCTSKCGQFDFQRWSKAPVYRNWPFNSNKQHGALKSVSSLSFFLVRMATRERHENDRASQTYDPSGYITGHFSVFLNVAKMITSRGLFTWKLRGEDYWRLVGLTRLSI